MARNVVYTGKEVCQGCGKPGSERARRDKNSLCKICAEEIKEARAELTHKAILFKHVRQHYFAYLSPSVIETEINLNEHCHELLKSLHNTYADAHYKGDTSLKMAFGSNGRDYIIPDKTFEALRGYLGQLENFMRKLSKEVESLPERAREEVAAEKTRIYNEGIEKGRDLLFSLNSGSITLDEFNAKLNYKGE